MSTALRITYDQFDVMVQAGAFSGEHRQRVELIRGEILPMSPIGAIHEVLVDRLCEWSFLHTSRTEVWIRVQNSIGFPELESVPEPDIAWVARKNYSVQRPQSHDVFLIIEVADSSLRNDLGPKSQLYAEAGVRDYWVVDANHRRVTVFRDPKYGLYQSQVVCEGDAVIQSLVYPDVRLVLTELFTATEAAS